VITHYVLLYDVVEGFAAKRAPFREEHLRLVRLAHERGQIVMAGALGEPPNGAMLVFRAGSPAPAEEFARRDPYVTNGVVTAWQVRPWTVVVGS